MSLGFLDIGIGGGTGFNTYPSLVVSTISNSSSNLLSQPTTNTSNFISYTNNTVTFDGPDRLIVRLNGGVGEYSINSSGCLIHIVLEKI